LSVARQVATELFDLLFFDDNQRIGAQVVQLPFGLARTDASLTTATVPPQSAAIPNPFSSDS
jgi:hypothetical protein